MVPAQDSGGQRYLATGSSPSYPLGSTWRDVRIEQVGATITVTVDGRTLATVTDGPGSPGWTTGERVYTSGGIGLYTEGALAEFDAVTVTRR